MGHTPLQNPIKFIGTVDGITPLGDIASLPKYSKPADPTRDTDNTPKKYDHSGIIWTNYFYSDNVVFAYARMYFHLELMWIMYI